jgi:hypothetical protein
MAKPTEPQTVRLVLNLPEAWHHELKVYAVVHKMSMKDVLVKAFELLKKQKPA